jgi:hypothetical protein
MAAPEATRVQGSKVRGVASNQSTLRKQFASDMQELQDKKKQ